MSQDRRDTLRVAALQPELRWLHPLPNMHAIRTMADEVCAGGQIDVLVLPEAFAGSPPEYGNRTTAPQARQFLTTLARAVGAHVIGGSIEWCDEAGVIRNSCFVVAPDGRELVRYDKRVLFSRERETRTPGDGPGIVSIGGWRVAVLICADLWDPVLTRSDALLADVICVPAKTAVPAESHRRYARHLWHQLALVRSIENGVGVAVADWAARRHEAARQAAGPAARETHWTCGATSVCDPGYRPAIDEIQRCAGERAAALVHEFSRERLERFREYRRAAGLLPS